MPCNNNCNQGRACDCAPAINDEPERPPMTRVDLLTLFLAGALSGGTTVLVLIVLGEWLNA